MDMIMLWLSKLLKVMFLISVLIFFSQLPRMLQKDAISKYYGLEKGQVVKVTYSGEITESHVTYRCIW
jgi:DNA-directed RNA polymerase I, II, and III subunit RPABC1